MQAILRRGLRFDYVVATGRSHSVEDLLRIAFAVVDLDWREHTHQDPDLLRRNEIAGLRGDASRARKDLGWEPTVSFEALVEGMVKTELERCASS